MTIKRNMHFVNVIRQGFGEVSEFPVYILSAHALFSITCHNISYTVSGPAETRHQPFVQNIRPNVLDYLLSLRSPLA